MQKVSPVLNLSRFPRCLWVRHFLELVPVIRSWATHRCLMSSYSSEWSTSAESRVLVSVEVDDIHSGDGFRISGAPKALVARTHIARHGRFGEGGSLTPPRL